MTIQQGRVPFLCEVAFFEHLVALKHTTHINTMGSMPTEKKRIYLNFFDYACTGSHMSPGQWRNPDDKGYTKDRLDYWINLAKLAERGKISFIFFADSYGGQEVFAGNSDAQLRAGNQTASMLTSFDILSRGRLFTM